MQAAAFPTVFACALVALSGCASAAQRKAAATHEAWVRTQTIQVRPFATDEAFASRLDTAPAAIGRRMGDEIVKALRAEGLTASLLKGDAPATAPIVVEGEFVSIDGGNQGVRWLAAGMITGAGAVQIEAEGHVLDQAGATLGTFRVSDKARGGFAGGDATELLEGCIEQMATDVAFQVISGEFNGGATAAK